MSKLADRLLGGRGRADPRPEDGAAPVRGDKGSLAVKLLEAKHGPDYRPPPNSRIFSHLWGDGPRETPELRRILALPRKSGPAPDLTGEFLHTEKCAGGCMLCRPRGPAAACSPGCARCADGEAHLWPIQSEALHWARIADGLLAPIGVGFGKTLICLLLPLAMKSKRAVLLVPPQMRDQLRGMIRTIARHWRLPAITFGGGPVDGMGRESVCLLRVFGYSEISIARGQTALEDADPDLVVADECFEANTVVITSRGPMKIGDVVEGRLRVDVLSMDPTTARFEWKAIVRWKRTTAPERFVEIMHERGVLRCTSEHKIWTEEHGYVEARNLEPSDHLLVVQGTVETKAPVGRPGEVLLSSVQRGLSSVFETQRDQDRLLEVRHDEACGQTRSCACCEVLLDPVRVLDSDGSSDVKEGEGRRHDHLLVVQDYEVCPQAGKEHRTLLLHPVFEYLSHAVFRGSPSIRTRKKWKEGSKKTGSDEVLPRVWGAVHETLEREAERQTDVLFAEVWTQDRDDKRARAKERIQGSEVSGAHACIEPDAYARRIGESARESSRPDVPSQRGKWTANEAAVDAGGSSRVSDRVSDLDQGADGLQVATVLLQGRSSVPGFEAGDRGGWQVPPPAEMEISGSAQGVSVVRSRVVCVEVSERGGSGRIDRSGGEGQFVYDLEVADNHNYVADGVLVSNCHLLRHRAAVRTRRFLRLFKNKPGVRNCDLSGTVTTRTPLDYGHLAELSLRKNSPLPKPWPELDDWGRVLGADVEFGRRLPPGALSKLAGGATDLDAVRAGFRDRLVSTPGVVATSEGALGTSLVIRIASPPPSAAIELALARLRDSWAVGGEEIEDAMRLAAVARQVALGFHYVWDWPNGVRDEEWLEARAAWHREMRTKLAHNPPAGMDSPLFLANAAASGRWRSEAWPAWAAVKGRPVPPTVPVWIDKDFAVRVAKTWLVAGDVGGICRGVIWYEHRAIGELVARRLALPRFGAGADAALLAATPGDSPAIVCSIPAHHRGKELQAWDRALVLGAPANGTICEQLLGRLHRPGQAADEVEFTWLESARDALDRAIEDARYEEATLGGRQKLLYARMEE